MNLYNKFYAWRPVVETLREEARKYGISDITIYNDQAENLSVGDNSCDAVIATFVLCSVQNQEQVLNEIMRVLKPGGKYIFIEHVAAEKGGALRSYQNLANPFNRLFGKNCHVNRDTLAAIVAAGFKDIDIEKENIKMIMIPWPHIRGVAYKIPR